MILFEDGPEGVRVAVEPFGFFVVDRDGRADHEALDSPFCATLADAEHFKDLLNRFPSSDGPLGSRQPFRVAPVGPVVDLKPFGFGVIDRDGDALTQHTYGPLTAAEGVAAALNEASPRLSVPLPRAPFAAVPLFYVPPPYRPAEAVKPDPRTERWAAIPKAGKP